MKRTALGLALLAAVPSVPALAQSAPAGDPGSAAAPGLAAAQPAQSAEDARISALEARIAALEAELQALRPGGSGTRAGTLVGSTATVTTGNVAASTAATDAGDDLEALAAEPGDDAAAAGDVAAPAIAATETATLEAPADAGGASGSGANAFNPAIAIILNGSLAHHSLDPAGFERSGFPLAGEAGPGERGFSLGESEVSFAANIDDKFYGQLTLSVENEDGEDHLGVEEAYVDTTALPNGLSARVGRFFSNIGYLNSHHAHTDSFFDRPLAYQAFLGGQYGDDGVQLRWVAPTSTFLEFGGEVFRGQSFPSGGAQRGGLGTRTLFAHAGGDAGAENEWLAGVSMLKTRTAGGEDGFDGDATVYVADATWKWAPQGNFKDGGVTFRSEYLIDDRDGLYVDPEGADAAMPWIGKRRGGYVEGVYRLNRTWDFGYRYDSLRADDTGPFASSFDPYRHSLEATWRNSEFSLVRLQLSREKPSADATDNAVVLQYQTSLGAHGAHKF
jgi:hypothetical protein